MVNKELVRRKLNKIIQYLTELSSVEEYTLQEYLDNYFIKRTAERLLQLIVEVATDINGHIIVDNGYSPPKTYYESFMMLSELGIIERKFASNIAPSAGLRNRLVHEYEEIDDKIVFNSVPEAVEKYQEYVAVIEKYLNDN
ncbi:MAG: type VII toxin-antitoxin system HepT family RNase toxin [Halanaerobiaceae bacterium]